MISTLTPIIVATVVSFCFKETRWLGIVSLAVISYFYPIVFVVAGIAGGCAYITWKWSRK